MKNARPLILTAIALFLLSAFHVAAFAESQSNDDLKIVPGTVFKGGRLHIGNLRFLAALGAQIEYNDNITWAAGGAADPIIDDYLIHALPTLYLDQTFEKSGGWRIGYEGDMAFYQDTSANDWQKHLGRFDLEFQGPSNPVVGIHNDYTLTDDPFGDVQFFARNQDIIPIHGGLDAMGVFGVIKVNLEQGGYQNIRGGNSYIQTVTWNDSECPIAEGILTHSQSTDPASPHYGDQTPVYSAKGWLPLPFCADEIEAAKISNTVISGE